MVELDFVDVSWKTGDTREKPSEQGENGTTNEISIGPESNPGHVRHHCSCVGECAITARFDKFHVRFPTAVVNSALAPVLLNIQLKNTPTERQKYVKR